MPSRLTRAAVPGAGLPRPDGEVWFTALLPYGVDHGPVADALGYGRVIENYDFIHDAADAWVHRDGRPYARFPHGWRLVTDRAGRVRAVIGMVDRTVSGTLVTDDYRADLSVAGNERVELDERGRVSARMVTPVVHPTS